MIAQRAAIGITVHQCEHRSRVGIGGQALGIAPKIRLKIHQYRFAIGFNLLEQQTHIIPVTSHESLIRQARQIAITIAGHLIQREHRNCAQGIGVFSDHLHIGAAWTVPGRPGTCTYTIQILIININFQALFLDIGQISRTQSDQHASWLTQLGGQHCSFLFQRSRWCDRRQNRRCYCVTAGGAAATATAGGGDQ